jgi:cellulose synthase/poly-beta-1,6-N-acetylglucosamine synthase-like glycosyltransferase
LVLVVADHCTDSTADVAQAYGAIVLRHDSGPSGKGPALAWAITQSDAALADYPIVAVFDADSRVNPSFFAEVRKAFQAGAQAVQGYVCPTDLPNSLAVTLAAYSEVLAQRIDGQLCARLGGSVRLRGTGMAFKTCLLYEILPEVSTQIEDAELTLLMADRGHRIVSVPTAVVYDPKPINLSAASRQRARWFRGQFALFRAHKGLIGRLLRQGPRGWWLLQDVLLKPRSFVWLALGVILGVICLITLSPWSLGALLAVLGATGAYYFGSLAILTARERVLYGRALLLSPVYVGMWLLSAITAWHGGGRWLRVRRE